jgi:hypothetical protein
MMFIAPPLRARAHRDLRRRIVFQAAQGALSIAFQRQESLNARDKSGSAGALARRYARLTRDATEVTCDARMHRDTSVCCAGILPVPGRDAVIAVAEMNASAASVTRRSALGNEKMEETGI